MKHLKFLLITSFCFFLCIAASCRKNAHIESKDPKKVEKVLLSKYVQGEISRCNRGGSLIYSCARNAYDAGTELFDEKGVQIGKCYYNSGAVDQICNELENCTVIYRVEKNIWGKPGVNLIE